jgi:hypothetical protein
VNHGQIIRLEGFGRPTTYNHPVGALIVTIFIAPVVAEEGTSPTTPTFQHTVPVSNSLARNEVKPTLPKVPLKKHTVKGKSMMIMTMAFVLVILSGIVDFYVVSNSGAHPSSNANSHAIPYPSYLPGSGKLVFNDPMKDDSEGNAWNPPNYRFCHFQGNALHVNVFGGKTDSAHFHPCIGKTPIFSNFAYQIKMTIIEGDCGGVVFHSNDPLLYYFYICQNRHYGLVRYMDNSDQTKNLVLREANSPQIRAGLGQTNMITVLVRGSYIYLYVNRIQIDMAYDTSYSQGVIGVLVKAFNTYTPTEVAFSDATVWPL